MHFIIILDYKKKCMRKQGMFWFLNDAFSKLDIYASFLEAKLTVKKIFYRDE